MRLRPMSRSLWLFPLFVTAACSHGTGAPSRLSDGGYSLACRGPLSDCLRHAERLCRDAGYTVTEARDVRELVGHEAGQSQVLIEKSDATVYCGQHAPRPPIELKREPEAVVAAPPPSAPAKPATPACVPGATQACIGPGGCSGGQACAADGSRFDACNCGSPTTTPSAPGPTPTPTP